MWNNHKVCETGREKKQEYLCCLVCVLISEAGMLRHIFTNSVYSQKRFNYMYHFFQVRIDSIYHLETKQKKFVKLIKPRSGPVEVLGQDLIYYSQLLAQFALGQTN